MLPEIHTGPNVKLNSNVKGVKLMTVKNIQKRWIDRYVDSVTDSLALDRDTQQRISTEVLMQEQDRDTEWDQDLYRSERCFRGHKL